MPLTTSYFAVSKNLEGRKISIARFNGPRIRAGIDEIISSFAPSPQLLGDYKEQRIEWEEYKKRYTAEQRDHYRNSPGDFERLLQRAEDENLVLLCYERFEGRDTKCHRFLLFDILKKVADRQGYEVEFFDEKPYVNRR